MDQALLSKIKVDRGMTLPVLEKILAPIETMLKETINANYQGERVLQLLRLQKADAFYRGIQNIAPQLDPATGNIAWVTYGQSTSKPGPDSGDRAFDYNPRKTKSYGDKYVAVLGQRPFWNVSAEPRDPTSENDRRGARQVNLLIEMLQGQWNVRVMNLRLFYYLFKTGTTFGYVRPVTDGRRFGYIEVPNMVMQPQQIGVDEFGQPIIEQIPVQQGTKKYPRTSVDVDLLNGYTITFPFNVVEKDKSPWVIFEVQKDKAEVLAALPNARDLVGVHVGSSISGDSVSATAAIVRAAAQSQTGTVRSTFQNEWNFRQTWVAREQLELIEDQDTRQQAIQQYPKGFRITQVESKTVEIVGIDFKGRLSSCLPFMSDYLFSDGASWGMFGMEDYWSNLLAVTSETLETGIPQYLVNPDYADVDALNRSRYSPNRFQSAIPRAGENLNNAFALFPTSRFPDQIPGMFEVIESQMQNSYGLLPQVYGEMPSGLTLGQAKMMLTQGLLQLGTPAELATRFWEETMTNGVNLYVDVAQQNPQQDGQEIDLALVKSSSWVIKGATGIPSSFAERKQMLQEIITTNQPLAEKLELGEPYNRSRLLEYLDMPEMESAAMDQIEAIQEHVDQLWSGQPAQGTDGQPQPSVPFDALVFDPQIAATLAKKALVEPRGQQRSGTPGYANVRAFLQAAQAAIPPAPAKPMTVSASLPLETLPANQMEAVLTAQGIQLPQPMGPPVQLQADMEKAQQQHAFTLDRNQQQADLHPPSQENPGLGAIQ